MHDDTPIEKCESMAHALERDEFMPVWKEGVTPNPQVDVAKHASLFPWGDGKELSIAN